MKILHILHEFPYPPNNGIRCDMLRRLDSFLALGHQVRAVTWATPGMDPAQVDRLAARLDGLTILPRPRSLGAKARRIWNLRRYPSYVAARIPTRAQFESIVAEVRHFAPDLLWLEGIHPAWLALELKRELGIPLAYRSHNIEHVYLAEQARLARSTRQRLALKAGTMGLERTERLVHAMSDRVFDISADDLLFWRERGYVKSDNLLPQPDPDILATMAIPAERRDIDLLYVGGLASPNNVAGLEWYFAQVHPLVRQSMPDIRILIAGRGPGKSLRSLCAQNGVELVADPAEVTPLYGRARVTMNPILHGSGMNIKTVDMLASGRPVVTTAKGARGLPQEIMADMTIADAPEDFARAIVTLCTAARKHPGEGDRAALIARLFGDGAVGQALAHFRKEAS